MSDKKQFTLRKTPEEQAFIDEIKRATGINVNSDAIKHAFKHYTNQQKRIELLTKECSSYRAEILEMKELIATIKELFKKGGIDL